MPGVRSIADVFDVHPNTAARVVSDLVHDGLLRSVQGRGTFVLAAPTSDGRATDELYASARALAIQARRLGLSRRSIRISNVLRTTQNTFGYYRPVEVRRRGEH